MGVIVHRLPAKVAAQRQAHHEMMKRLLLSRLGVAVPPAHQPNRRTQKPINTV